MLSTVVRPIPNHDSQSKAQVRAGADIYDQRLSLLYGLLKLANTTITAGICASHVMRK